MRKTILLATALVACMGLTKAQTQNTIPCYTDQVIAKKIAENPKLAAEYQRSREAIRAGIGSTEKAGGPRIIPVVFHIIHAGGAENISRDQLLDQLRVLNEDYSRTNVDAINTRPIFQDVAANCNIEFRLAQKDPDGNCTDGIVRVYSSLTASAGDGVKALSYWPSNKYLNIWVVKTIANDGSSGTILGYAQLPGFGAAQTDGVVIRHDVVGTIGSINSAFSNKGRTLTHEVGHWLGLLHTFQGGCTGGFFGEDVDDTPPVVDANYGCDTTRNTCHNDNPDLPDMIENFMDYSDGDCQNMFTLGQLASMNSTLAGTRSNITSSNNLVATGTDGSASLECKPIARFYSNHIIACVGDDVNFFDDSYNGTVDTRSWAFSGGSPASSTSANPTVQYNTPGYYEVSLNVSNTQGSDTKTVSQYIFIMPEQATETQWFYSESFEGSNPNNEDWFVENNDGLGNQWQQANTGYTGSKSMKFNNFSGNPDGAKDNLYLPPIDMTQINSPSLTFKVAYAQKPGGTFSSPSEDGLKMYVSTNCGASWQARYSKSGADLASTGTSNSAFTPNSQGQWKEETVNMTSYATRPNVLIRFEVTSNAGNNIYLDDVNIYSTTGVEDLETANEISLVPNPAAGQTNLSFGLTDNQQVSINIFDLTGRKAASIINTKLNAGQQTIGINTNHLSRGVYYVQLIAGTRQYIEKLVLQ